MFDGNLSSISTINFKFLAGAYGSKIPRGWKWGLRGFRGCRMLKNPKNPQNFNVFTIFAGFPGVARVAGVAVKYASDFWIENSPFGSNLSAMIACTRFHRESSGRLHLITSPFFQTFDSTFEHRINETRHLNLNSPAMRVHHSQIIISILQQILKLLTIHWLKDQKVRFFYCKHQKTNCFRWSQTWCAWEACLV